MKRIFLLIMTVALLVGCTSTAPDATSMFDKYRASQATTRALSQQERYRQAAESIEQARSIAEAETATEAETFNISDEELDRIIREAYAMPTEERKRMIQATTQLAMERNGVKNNTSPQLSQWTITSQTLGETVFWTSVTNDRQAGRVKAIFTWSGQDDDLMLVYLLIGGREYVDVLSSARQKALD